MINPMQLLKFKKEWEAFAKRHPKFIQFLDVVKDNYIREGTVIEITVTDPDGKAVRSNLRASAEDVAVFEQIKELLG